MKFLKKSLVIITIFGLLFQAIPTASEAKQADNVIRINPVDGIGNDFIMGADVSMLNDIVENGGKYYDIGSEKTEDCLEILKKHGINWIRLRLWNDPYTNENGKVGNDTVMIDGKPAPAGTPAGAGTCDLATTIAAAKKAKALGMKFLLNFHYSDFWADPGKQVKPKAWKNLTGSELQDAVYNYTKETLQEMKDEGILPDMVQVGNETNNGMLHPEGSTANGYAGWIGLINAATKAIREVEKESGKKIKIMIHLADGGDNDLYRRVFDRLTDFSKADGYVPSNDEYNEGKTGIDFDVIGFSYYPFWHGKLEKLKQNINDIAQRYGKEVAVAEIGYGYTFDNGDGTSNAFGQGSDVLSGYQATVQGQAQYIRDVIEVVAQAKDGSGNNVGIGVFYWAPEWIPVLDEEGNNKVGWITGGGNDSENRALFDFTGHALPSLDVFNLVKKDISELPGGVPYTYEITGLRGSSVTTAATKMPQTPETVLADFSDGSIRPVPVVWDKIDQSKLNKLHSFTVNGSVEGTPLKAVLHVDVIGKMNYVEDPGFEAGDFRKWNVTEDSPEDVETKIESSPGNNAYTGDRCFSYWISPNASGFTIQQTITGLPNGSYTLKAVSHGGDTAPGEGSLTRYMFARDYGGEEKRVEFTNKGWRNWVAPEIKNINVTNGSCTIGVTVQNAGAGTWGKLDDFELYPDLSSADLTLPYSIGANSLLEANLSYSKLIYNIYAQDITIGYNADKLEYVSAAGADDDTVVTAVYSGTDGEVRLLAINKNPNGMSWDADSLKLTFMVKTGQSIQTQDLSISEVKLGTAYGSVVEPAGTRTLRADAPASGGGGSSNKGTSSDTGRGQITMADGEITVNKPAVIDGIAVVNIDKSALDSAFSSAKADEDGTRKVTINMPEIENLSSYEVVLPASSLSSGSKAGTIAISTTIGTITIPVDMLPADAAGASSVGIQLAAVDTAALDDELRAQIGDRPVVKFLLKLDGKPVSWNNPDAPVTIFIPYKPDEEELKNPEFIVAWYIDDSGNAIPVPNCKYNQAAGRVEFSTTHLSKYAVAYSHKTFSDLGNHEWARHAVEVLASKGVVKGISEGLFAPGANVTRGDFAVMLVNALGLSAKVDENFIDVEKTDYYYEAVGIARKLGVSNGTGSGMFSPKDCITRQDMMVMIMKALSAAGRISKDGTTASLERFNDRSDISEYAYESISRLVGEGLVQGSNNALKPLDNASRAEAAVLICRASKK